MKISVLVPTYRRSQDLKNCLKALACQTHPADEVLVVVRDTDEETREFLKTFNIDSLPLRVIDVSLSGQVAALNTGLNASIGDIIAITDDDAAPHRHWLESILGHFLKDPQVGGVGGRDWTYIGGHVIDASRSPGASNIVGKVSWFGRTIGNHHLGEGAAREVDILKGANMSYRRQALAGLQFDRRLLGTGAQVCNDMAFSLTVKRQGWTLIYDPAVSIDHFPGQRFDEDQRNAFNFDASKNLAFNETLTILDHLKGRHFIYMPWAFGVGTRACFGIIQMLRFLPSEGSVSIQKLLAAFQGRWLAYQKWCQS